MVFVLAEINSRYEWANSQMMALDTEPTFAYVKHAMAVEEQRVGSESEMRRVERQRAGSWILEGFVVSRFHRMSNLLDRSFPVF